MQIPDDILLDFCHIIPLYTIFSEGLTRYY